MWCALSRTPRGVPQIASGRLQPELLACRQVTFVRKHGEVHQRREQGGEVVDLVLVEAGVEQGFDAADDTGRGDGGVGGAGGEELTDFLVDAGGEVVEEGDAAEGGVGGG